MFSDKIYSAIHKCITEHPLFNNLVKSEGDVIIEEDIVPYALLTSDNKMFCTCDGKVFQVCQE